MEQLKRNGFWVALAAVGGLIVVAFVLFVLPSWTARSKAITSLTTLNKQLKEIQAKGEEVPSDKQVEAIVARAEEMKKDLEKCKQWLKGYDDAFETWFQELSANPELGHFNSVYSTTTQELEKKIKDKGIVIGVRAVEDSGIPGTTTAPTGGIKWPVVGGATGGLPIKEIQKRFWITLRVAAALLRIQDETQNKGISALEEVVFAPGPKGPAGEDYPGWPSTPFELPGKYGTVLTCGIRVEMLNSQVPKFLKLLLEADDPAPKLLSHLRGVRVTLTEPLPDKHEETINVPEGQPSEPPKMAKEKELKDQLWQPRPVRLFVTYEVFDFDGEKLAKPFSPAPPAGS